MSIRIFEAKQSQKLVTKEIGRSRDNKTLVVEMNGEISIFKSPKVRYGDPEGPANFLSMKKIREYQKKSDASKGPVRLAQERKDDRKRRKLWKEGEKYQ